MIYNNTLPIQYGAFSEIGGSSNVAKNKPTPTAEDYTNGYINRYLVKKVNENFIFEVSYITTQNINTNLYKFVEVKWRISGPKSNVYKNGILDKNGVEESNRFEIDRVKKEEGIDLSTTLTNLLEYWRGR
jgi:hypothetical protein